MEEHTSNKMSLSMELTGKIIMATIFLLFLIIAFILILQLYSRCLLSRIVQSTPAPRRSAPIPTSKKELDAALLQSIPVVEFSPEDFKEGLECAVCLSELVRGERARLLPRCNHGFHVDCIDMWFKSNSTCPLCRNPVSPSSSNPTQDLESGSSSMESPVFPTNILFWGNQMQISSRGVCLEESQTSSSSSANIRADGMLVIDIPNQPSSSSSSSAIGAVTGSCSGDEDMKSVVTARLRTLKRLLSGERRVGNSHISSDLEQVETRQS